MENQSSGFKDLLNHTETIVGQEWKELLLLMLGAFIGSYGKIIDYWFSDTDKDKMLVQKMDEEDGVSLSNTMGDDSPEPSTPIKPIVKEVEIVEPEIVKQEPRIGIEVDEDGDGKMDGIDEKEWQNKPLNPNKKRVNIKK